MKIKLVRTKGSADYTEGKMYINDVFECYTVEDAERKDKIQNKTAIPKGTYEVIMSKSTRFNKIMPEVLNVPNFTGIRIHAGNTSKDTEGCIIVGAVNSKWDDDFVGSSVVAIKRLYPKLSKAYKANEKITLEIV